jgi:hypothetical protein
MLVGLHLPLGEVLGYEGHVSLAALAFLLQCPGALAAHTQLA